MTKQAFGCWALAVLLAGAGCSKREASPDNASQAVPKPAAPPAPAPAAPPAGVPLVDGGDRSRHFEAVNRHLELGGTLYLYADVDGDAFKIADGLRSLAENLSAAQPAAVALKQDYRKLFADLGIADVKAVGLSSVRTGGGYRNRAFFYTPQGRRGLLAGLGGPVAPFLYARMAPADVDFYSENELDLPAVYATVKTLVARIGGEEAARQLEAALRAAGQPAGLSVLDLIQGLKGRSVMILSLDPEKNLALPTPKPVTIPAFSLLVRIDGVGPALAGALDRLPLLEKSSQGTMTVYAFKQPLPVGGLQPAFAVDGNAFFLATRRDFLTACRERQSGLDQSPDFQRALAAMGPEGNGLSYVSPRFFARLRQLGEMNPDGAPEMQRMFQMIANQLPQVDRPLVSVRQNLPDGILVRSFWNRSLKQDLAMVAMYNPVSIGLVAAMAIPGFQKVRQASQEKVVLNNLRQLSAAADQYYMETGASATTYDQLVGPGKLIRQLTPALGEDYRTIDLEAGKPVSVRLPDGRVIESRP